MSTPFQMPIQGGGNGLVFLLAGVCFVILIAISFLRRMHLNHTEPFLPVIGNTYPHGNAVFVIDDFIEISQGCYHVFGHITEKKGGKPVSRSEYQRIFRDLLGVHQITVNHIIING